MTHRKTLGLLFMGALAAAPLAGGRAWAEEPREEEEGEPGPMGPELSVAEEQRVLDDIKEANPEMYRDLEEAKRRRPEQFRRKAREFAPMLRDPEKRKILLANIGAEFKIRKLAKEYRGAADDKAKEKIKGELKSALDEAFEAKLSGHEMHIKHMESELARMKVRIEKRRKVKKQIVERRLGEIVGDEESWEMR